MKGKQVEPLKHRLEMIPPPPGLLPGYEDMMNDMIGWEEKNLAVFDSCLETTHKLCEAIGKSDKDIQDCAEELCDEKATLPLEEFCTKWVKAWEKTTRSLVENTEVCSRIPGLDEGYRQCLTKTQRLHWSVTTLPFPYVTKKDLDRLSEDLANVRSFVENRVAPQTMGSELAA